MRSTLLLVSVSCALAACSSEAPAPEASESTPASEAVAEAAIASAATPAATPSPSASATPTADASPGPSPTPSITPAVAAKPKPEPSPNPSSSAVPVALAAPPPAAFARCAVCHSAEKGAGDKLGPNLYGVYGTRAGAGSFAFSEALKGAGITWTDSQLDQWIAGPAAMVPGNTMGFPGIKDPAKRAEIIAFLKSRR